MSDFIKYTTKLLRLPFLWHIITIIFCVLILRSNSQDAQIFINYFLRFDSVVKLYDYNFILLILKYSQYFILIYISIHLIVIYILDTPVSSPSDEKLSKYLDKETEQSGERIYIENIEEKIMRIFAVKKNITRILKMMTIINIIFSITTRIGLEYNQVIDTEFIIMQVMIYSMLLFILIKFQSRFWIFTNNN